jgi:hypothetical protein
MGDPLGKLAEFVDSDDNLTLAAFVYQATSKETSSSSFMSADLETKVETVVNSLTGRTLGVTVFSGAPSAPATFNLNNAINKVSMIGAGLKVAEWVGLLSAKWGKRGEKLFIGGAIGGVFDDKPSQVNRSGPSPMLTAPQGLRY